MGESELILAMQKVNLLYFNSSINQSAFDVQFQFGLYWKNVCSDLTGIYQEKNIRTVLACLEPMRKAGFLINEQNLRDGLSFVKKNTGLLGRWQILNKEPLTICDTGHNINGIAYVLEQIGQQNFEHLHFVIGMVKDKDIVKILALLPVNATYYFTKANIPRALSELDLQSQASNFQLKGKTYPSVKEAIAAANNAASINDLIFIGGSNFVVAEAI
jgi:dihydrofolate synthase/folylpolyglutamate synthase